MKENKNFKFKTNVSLDCYEKKTDASACLSKQGAKAVNKSKMAFKVQDVTVPEFLSLATSGHTFCGLFAYDANQKYWVTTTEGKSYQQYPEYKNGANKGAMKLTFKADQYFCGSQIVFVDVDKTKFKTIPEYLAALRYKPTFTYPSYSDNIEKNGVVSRRFRLGYVFDQMLGKDELLHISRAINDCIVIDTAEPMEDDCGTRISQYMNGCFGNNETYETDIIYSLNDFPKIDYCVVAQPTVTPQKQGVIFNEQLIEAMGTMSYSDFMHYHSWMGYRYRVEKPDWIAGTYQMTDDTYLQLWFYREKVLDGQKRRRKLFKNACLRRLMFPDIDADTLLFNLYVDFCRFFDNSDGVITLKTLMNKVKNAMEMSHEQLLAYCDYEIEYWKKNRPTFILSPAVPHTVEVVNWVRGDIAHRNLDLVYDRSKSVKENQAITGVPIASLYRYCELRGIDTNPNKLQTEKEKREAARQTKQEKIELFKKFYNPNMTIMQNQQLLNEKGLTLSKSSIPVWAEKYYVLTPTFSYEWSVPTFDFTNMQMPEIEILDEPIIMENYNPWQMPQGWWINS